MKLEIDTADYDKTVIRVGEINHWFESKNLSEHLVPEIKKFFKKSKINFKDISKVEVRTGDHFSRTRTTIAVANGLIFSLKLRQKMLAPHYKQEPNITLPKK